MFYQRVSDFFEAEGDFEENRDFEEERANEALLREQQEEAEAQEALDSAEYDPCCYNSSRNHGTGEHEYDCPNR